MAENKSGEDGMLEIMWIWGILGLVLLGFEMLTGTMYVLWFGIAALLLAILTWLMPAMPIAFQLFLFAGLSIGALVIWRRNYKKHSTDLHIGQSQGDDIGRVGTMIEAVTPHRSGRIRFTQGVMGSREWAAVSSEDIEAGAEAVIIAVEGNSLRVKRH
jgi:membrane protein implicated in regulation of membrane protease activity